MSTGTAEPGITARPTGPAATGQCAARRTGATITRSRAISAAPCVTPGTSGPGDAVCRGTTGPAVATVASGTAGATRTTGLPITARRRRGSAADPGTAVATTRTLPTRATVATVTADRPPGATVTPATTGSAVHAFTAGVTGLRPGRAVATGRPIAAGPTSAAAAEVSARTPGTTGSAIDA
ncbi:MAG: hypothetical protein CK431_29705 [Mycobacterium sp.]|nr:MAG: hypothetical protein CK431_29705 [Mycobacterium sp.]